MSRTELYTPWELAQVEPPVLPRRCQSCGRAGPTVFLPSGLGAGRRVCRDCLRVYDGLRAAKA
jgi:hypothetical protein